MENMMDCTKNNLYIFVIILLICPFQEEHLKYPLQFSTAPPGGLTGTGVLQLEVLIRKLPSIDGFPPSAIVVSKIPTLKYTTYKQL